MKKLLSLMMGAGFITAALIAGCDGQKNNPSNPGAPWNAGQGGTTSATATGTVVTTPVFTATPQGTQTTINLGSAANFAVLANIQVVNSGATTICGDIGVSPGISTGSGYVMNCGGIAHAADTLASNAQLDLTAAYNDALSRRTASPLAGELGGVTLYPGLYGTAGSLDLSTGNLTLDALGNPNGVFIFQVGSSLTARLGHGVLLAGGAKASNVFWQVGGICTLDLATSFKGTIMTKDQLTLNAGAQLEGRAFSQTSQVMLNANSISIPSP